ncbi:uncharacterized protein LOC134263107 isoform X2 [Saccostrea cucullata]|uniref:uncharacterized protein LOC134263107 isoform X2 n=1 Tax=Saccostrea cuccullata TaxID=36930 RepID=UPI002ED24BB7
MGLFFMSITPFIRLSVILLYNIEQLPPASSTVEIVSCNGKARLGSVIYFNYQKMDMECNCLIKPQFSGTLQFASDAIKFKCHMKVDIFDHKRPNHLVNLPCGNGRTSVTFNVTYDDTFQLISQPVNLTTGTFHQPIYVFEEATFNGTISVSCGIQKSSTSITVLKDELINTSTATNSADKRCINSKNATSRVLHKCMQTWIPAVSHKKITDTIHCKIQIT